MVSSRLVPMYVPPPSDTSAVSVIISEKLHNNPFLLYSSTVFADLFPAKSLILTVPITVLSSAVFNLS